MFNRRNPGTQKLRLSLLKYASGTSHITSQVIRCTVVVPFDKYQLQHSVDYDDNDSDDERQLEHELTQQRVDFQISGDSVKTDDEGNPYKGIEPVTLFPTSRDVDMIKRRVSYNFPGFRVENEVDFKCRQKSFHAKEAKVLVYGALDPNFSRLEQRYKPIKADLSKRKLQVQFTAAAQFYESGDVYEYSVGNTMFLFVKLTDWQALNGASGKIKYTVSKLVDMVNAEEHEVEQVDFNSEANEEINTPETKVKVIVAQNGSLKVPM